MKGACRAQDLSAMLPSSKANTRGSRQSAKSPRECLRWLRAPRRPFVAEKSCPLASSAGNGFLPRKKNNAHLRSLKGNQVMHPFVFAGQKTMLRCVIARGKKVVPCSAFAKALRLENEAYKKRYMYLGFEFPTNSNSNSNSKVANDEDTMGAWI